MTIKNFILDLFFPKICVNCETEGDYLCQDCFSLIDFLPINNGYKSKNLVGLLAAVPYNNFIIKKIIGQFKYEPFVKDLSEILAYLIIHQLRYMENIPFIFLDKNEKLIIPIPSTKKRVLQRGFNHTEEIAKKLSQLLAIPFSSKILFKTKETPPQVGLSLAERKINVKEAFSVLDKTNLKNKTVLLVDDVFTTGSTMEEAAKTLKEAGAKRVFGIAVARE